MGAHAPNRPDRNHHTGSPESELDTAVGPQPAGSDPPQPQLQEFHRVHTAALDRYIGDQVRSTRGDALMYIGKKKRFFVLAFFFLADLLLSAQQPVKQELSQTIQVFRSDARLVVVDVVITDNAGHVVHGLKTQDFTVLEDGKPQTVVAFDERRPEASPKSTPPAVNLLKNEYTNYAVRSETGALTVLLLDTMNSSRQDLVQARNDMVSFLKKLPRGKSVALYTLGSQLRMVQGFTDDTDTLIAAAEQLSSRPHSVYTNNRELSATIGELKESGLLNAPRAFAAMVRFLGDDYQGKLEMRSQDTLDALTQVARALAVVPGRKNLIWISGGFPFDSLTNADRLQRVSALLAATRIAVYPVDVRGVLSMQPDGQTRDSEIFAPVQTQSYESIAGLDEENRTLVETMQNVARITGGRASKSQRPGSCDRRCDGYGIELLHAGLPTVQRQLERQFSQDHGEGSSA